MFRRLVTSLVGGALLLTLAACGQATEAADGGSTSPTATESLTAGTRSDAAPAPAGGCTPKVTSQVDYGRAPHGSATPEEAAMAFGGVPDGTAVMAPSEDGRGTRIWVVDPKTDQVKVEVSVVRGPTGWYVDGVSTCA